MGTFFVGKAYIKHKHQTRKGMHVIQRIQIAEFRTSKVLILFLVAAGLCTVFAACQPNQAATTDIPPTSTMPEPTDFPAGFPTPDPDEFAACVDEGGRWEVLGFSGPGCNLPSSDGGKSCLDSEECESGCLGDPNLVMITDRFGPPIPDHARVDELNAKNEENVGFCSSWQGNFGCQVWVEKGRYVAICVD